MKTLSHDTLLAAETKNLIRLAEWLKCDFSGLETLNEKELHLALVTLIEDKEQEFQPIKGGWSW